MNPPAPPTRRGPAWWCWPLILFSLVPYDLILPRFFSPPGEELVKEAAEADAPVELAMLKLQSQVLIGSAKFDESQTDEIISELRSAATGSRSRAAVALVENFVLLEERDKGAILETLDRLENKDLAAAVARAIREGVDPEGRERLRAHLGWFADLAPAPGPEPPPLAAEIESRSVVVLAVLLIFFLAAVGGVCLGAVLLVVHLVRIREGKNANAFRAEPLAWGILLECFALYLGIMTLGALAAGFVDTSLSIVGYGLAAVAPLLWPLARGVRWTDFRKAIGWHRGSGWLREVGAGIVGYFGLLSIASIGIALTLLLVLVVNTAVSAISRFAPGGGGNADVGEAAPEAHPIIGWMYEGDWGVRIACFLLAAVFAPLFEETFFRGAMHRYLRGRMRFLAAALLSGVIFAALHPQGFYAIPVLGAMGVGFALIREWRDSLIAPMVAHAINNGLLVVLLWTLL